jgi:hypothetical protein
LLNSKSKIPNHKQYPNPNYQMSKSNKDSLKIYVLVIGVLAIGVYLLFGAWYLEFQRASFVTAYFREYTK